MNFKALLYFFSLIVFLYGFHPGISQKHKIVVILKSFGSDEELKLTKDQQKELKDFCKSRGIVVTSKDASYNEYKKKLGEIFLILHETGGDLEEKKEKMKEEMTSIPEISRFIKMTFYGSINAPDSTALDIFSFPYAQKENVKFQKTISHTGADMMACIKESLDSCLVNNFLK